MSLPDALNMFGMVALGVLVVAFLVVLVRRDWAAWKRWR